ncbi:MAG: lipocalin family protein [Bacteroidota bacterium]
MKSIFKSIFVFSILAFLSSCVDNDEFGIAEQPIVGEWEFDHFTLSELPNDFISWEGATVESVLGEQEYVIDFRGDNSYSRSFTFQNGTDELEDNGIWTIEGNELKLNSEVDDFFDEEFDIESTPFDSLFLSQVVTIDLIPDSVLQTVDFDSLSSDEFDRLSVPVPNVKTLFQFRLRR